MQYGFGAGSYLTPAVKRIIIACVGVFILQQFIPSFDYLFGLVPRLVSHGFVWQLATYMFLHGGIFHIFFNLLIFWMIGSALESYWGSRLFLRYFFICGVSAGVVTWLVHWGSPTITIGASGAIYGLLLAYGLLFPDAVIYLYFFIPIRAKYLAIILGGIEFFSSISRGGDGIAHVTHLAGLVAGYIYLRGSDRLTWWRGKVRRRWNNVGHKVVDIQRARRAKRQDDIDAILDKISQRGVESLTPEEKRRLRDAGAHNDPSSH
jgi:membrane associated rhomboid family serine protease